MTSVTPIEQMIVTAARLIPDDSVLLVGTQWPIAAALLAKALHAPGCIPCVEGGVVFGKSPDRIPLYTADPVCNSSAVLLGDSLDTMGMILHRGLADFGILAAAAVDRYGNINTTCIGEYGAPKFRFGGSGGANDFGSLSAKTIIILEHEKRRFPERVDFITTPGYLNGKDSRLKAGLREGTGPFAVVTTLGLFHFDEIGEMVLTAYHPASSIEEIKENIQWDLKVADSVGPLDPPTERELTVLRKSVDPRGMYLEGVRMLRGRKIII
jgi:glutaconate CoA-transferase, subunit B